MTLVETVRNILNNNNKSMLVDHTGDWYYMDCNNANFASIHIDNERSNLVLVAHNRRENTYIFNFVIYSWQFQVYGNVVKNTFTVNDSVDLEQVILKILKFINDNDVAAKQLDNLINTEEDLMNNFVNEDDRNTSNKFDITKYFTTNIYSFIEAFNDFKNILEIESI